MGRGRSDDASKANGHPRSRAGVTLVEPSGPKPGPARPKRVCLLGATGTIGRSTADALVRRGHEVVCLVRRAPGAGAALPAGAEARVVAVFDAASLTRDGLRGERFDAVISCMASRTGAPRDAWAIDHRAHVEALRAAEAAGVGQFVLLSAICVQKPRLAFQHAKLAFERELIGSGMAYSIVRPTAYFKSLSGQIDRVRRGRPFLVFGDGELTSCKPISDRDLADYLVDCLDDARRLNRVLPIGGPGPAITPRRQGEALFRLLGRPARFRHVPLGLLDGIAATLGALAPLSAKIADKAELARIGRYYAGESMLWMDPETGRYDADATPSTGTETLVDFYAAVLAGAAAPDRGDHAVF